MSTVAVDPRIRARRVAVARDAGRRRLRRLLLVGALALLALAGLAVTFTPALDIERIDVRGTGRTDPEAVTDAAGVAAGDPLAWFDTGAAERAVARLPWVDRVAVQRSWSGTVTIEVTERTPAAAVAAEGGGWLVADGEGRVLSVADAQPADLAVVEGAVAAAEPGEQLGADVVDALRVAGAVPAAIRADVAVVRGRGADVEAELRSGGTLVLGGTDEAEEKLASAAAVLATVPPECVDRLDVSLPAAPALIRVPGCG